MARFRLTDESTWPAFYMQPSNGAKVSKLYVPRKNGSRITVVVGPGARDVVTNDERAVRVMRADPRFEEIV